MPKEDKAAETGLDVQVLYPQSGLPNSASGSNTPASLPNGGGYVMTGGPSNQPIIFVPGPTAAPAQPSVVVITVGPKKDEEKKEKKSSSVFQRL
jgi:hypothetical protein